MEAACRRMRSVKRALFVAAIVCILAGGALFVALNRNGSGDDAKPKVACSAARASVSTLPLGGGSSAVKASGTNGGGCLNH